MESVMQMIKDKKAELTNLQDKIEGQRKDVGRMIEIQGQLM